MPPSTLERDLQIDGWQVVRRLGAGGMSEVYLVARGAERAALKLLYARDSPELAAQIRADVAALARLAHPSLVQIDAVGVFAGRPYLRMEYVEGRLLRDLISHPPPPPASVAALTQQLAEALAYLHARGQSHGDVTPANAVVDRAGRVRLLDVGVATSLHGSRPPVTPAYAPPEWSRAPRVDGARADAYALGVIACELLTGEFARPRAPATEAAPLDPGDAAPGPLRELIAALTEPDPRRRMTAAAAAERLVAHAGAPAPVTLAPTIAGSYEDAPPTEVTPPRQLGRYLVLRVLGAGGMGVVYLAYDPELRREVAVKVLHERTAAEGDRLRWEAQAMARLSHPNIVAVFDVGEVDGRVFFACEYIEGDTLGSVLAEERTRSWRATLSLFLAAGRGLVAAHSAGLVHRDFKPANVLVGGDGVVKVTDFGLARERPDALTTAEEVASEATPLGATDGRLVGTPVYMAAEQLRREPADARTDQFNFCVSLHMALYGAHPFAGATPAERRASVLAGARAPRPRGDAPVWLAAAIDRGLSLKPGDRWPSMAALLRAIERRLTRRRRWPAVAALAVLATSAGGYALRERAAQARCEAQGASILERWDAATRGRVHAALRESGVGHAEDTWTRVAARIDQWTDAWRDARVSACLAARADELQARARGRCLDQDRWRLEGLLEVLVEPGRELANNAINAAAALPERDHCEEFARRPRALQGGESRELDELHRGLILARALAIAGRNDEALERIQAARAEAERLDDATARVEGLLVDGDIRGELGDYERSEALFAQAWFSALRSGHDRAAARAATELVEIVGVDRGEHARGREWGEHAAAMIDHLGADVTATMRLELTRSRALIDQEAAAYDDADAGLRRALDLAEETFGPAHPLVARSLNDLSVALYQRSRYDEARGYSDRALEVFAAAVGPLHPSYANALMSRGGLLLAVGDASGARQAFEEAARVFESAHGPDHRLVAIALGNIAAVLHAEGDFERARAYAERALAIGERVHGPQHTMVLNQRSSIAVMSLALGDSATALDQLQRGLAAAEEGLGPEHPLTSLLLVNLGAALSAEGRHEEALAASRRGLALVEALYGSDHLDVAFALVNIADTLHALGRDDEARPLAERALAIQERILGAANPTLSRSLTPLARILAARGEGVAAEGHLRRAIALLEPNPGSRDLPIALTELGSLLLAEGRESEAIAPLERAITLQVDRRGFTGTLARSRFLLARALDDTGSDPSRARTLAEQARDDLASSGERDAAKRDEITEWLTQRAAKR